MVVERDGLIYTVEVKGKWVGRRGDPLSFTANEVGSVDRHIICVAYVDRDACVEVECVPSAEFQKKWIPRGEGDTATWHIGEGKVGQVKPSRRNTHGHIGQ